MKKAIELYISSRYLSDLSSMNSILYGTQFKCFEFDDFISIPLPLKAHWAGLFFLSTIIISFCHVVMLVIVWSFKFSLDQVWFVKLIAKGSKYVCSRYFVDLDSTRNEISVPNKNGFAEIYFDQIYERLERFKCLFERTKDSTYRGKFWECVLL